VDNKITRPGAGNDAVAGSGQVAEQSENGRLVHFQCARCCRAVFRHRTAYELMMMEQGRAWCVLCAPPRYRPHFPSRELLDVTHALIAHARATLADGRRGQQVATRPCARCGAGPGVARPDGDEPALCVACILAEKGRSGQSCIGA
jgi:hypothetical protein